MFLWKVLKIFFKNIMARRLHVYVTLNQLLFTCKMQEHFIKALSFKVIITIKIGLQYF